MTWTWFWCLQRALRSIVICEVLERKLRFAYWWVLLEGLDVGDAVTVPALQLLLLDMKLLLLLLQIELTRAIGIVCRCTACVEGMDGHL